MIEAPGVRPDPLLEPLLAREAALAGRCRDEEIAYSGLKDLETLLELAEVRLAIALRALAGHPPPHELIRGKAVAAVQGLEELLGENLSEDQRQAVTDAGGYSRVKDLFQQFIVQGGGGYLAEREQTASQRRRVARTVVAAIRKYASSPDCYQAGRLSETLPAPLRGLVGFLLPYQLPEAQESCGIEEGEEQLYSAAKLRLPLSQAVHYLENQLLPELERRLAEQPGDRSLQESLRSTREKLAAYRRMRFVPRSTPIVIEHGFYTEWWSGFTAEGELLVSVPLTVQYRSGTNLDRLRDLVVADVVRRLAGKGVSPDLDREVRFRRSLESGLQGSSRLPRSRLNTRRGFLRLKGLYPLLQRLEDRREFAALVELAVKGGKAVESLLAEDKGKVPLLP
jgi:hypothetical protein